MPYSPKPGDIGLVSSNSLIGHFVRFGQAIVGDHAHVTHAFIVLPGGEIIEAMPGGAKFASIDKYPDAVYSRFDLTDAQRYDICEAAIRMEGTPYSFLDYLSLFLTHLVELKWIPLKYAWLPNVVRKRVQDSGHMICSQLCAEAYRIAGVPITGDSLSMDQTPGDLARIILEYRGGPIGQ
jgi:hypothetical protein